MDSDDNVLLKVGSHTSSSAISTPEENGNTNDFTKAQSSQVFIKYGPKKDLFHPNLDKEKKLPNSSKFKIGDELFKSIAKCKKHELKKLSSNPSASTGSQTSKQPRKDDHPARLFATETSLEQARTWTCKNSACKAILNSEDIFCKRCSCCICHLFDDNKDPSLWLVCSSESGGGDWCGLSCHVECAFQCQKAGVVDLGQSMQLDGSYCCASCGKVSGIIGYWKKQLAVAKDARRVDILCHRIYLSYRILNGTLQFKELHGIVEDAKAKLEAEVGPVNGVSARMARGLVSRLPVAADVQKLCCLGIEKADEWLTSSSSPDTKQRDSLPAACKFQFEEITWSSLLIVLKEPSSSAPCSVKGYKLWYSQSRERVYQKEPIVIPRAQRRILISNLQPCTEYAFRIISFTDEGDLGHSEAKCFTKSVEIFRKESEQAGTEGCSSSGKREPKTPNTASSGFKVRNLGKILRLAWAQEEGCYEEFYKDDLEEESCDGRVKPDGGSEEDQGEPSVIRQLDLNIASVPDLNDDLPPPMESSPESQKNDGSGDSRTRAVGEIPAVESHPDRRKLRESRQEDACDGDSTLVSGGSPTLSYVSGELDDNYEYCIKVIRWLECGGHIENNFRMKLLTWFSLRSTEQERRVVVTFIRTLIEEPRSLAGQLLDSFSEIINCKRTRNGFCSKLWH
ncbi:VIN3-like protein 1 [Platanthera zijinensis]|uniref:VIN3-like protein 1 n=1 Tax=Platanthera zijinensis TaxID=2320716 RepID=A0AAP0BSZ4_9ASPA